MLQGMKLVQLLFMGLLVVMTLIKLMSVQLVLMRLLPGLLEIMM